MNKTVADILMIGSSAYILSWIKALVLTLVIEVPVYTICARLLMVRVPNYRTVAFAAVLATLVTHPLLWFVWPRLFTDGMAFIVSGELLVVAMEATIVFALVRFFSPAQALCAALIANGASFVTGLLAQLLDVY